MLVNIETSRRLVVPFDMLLWQNVEKAASSTFWHVIVYNLLKKWRNIEKAASCAAFSIFRM